MQGINAASQEAWPEEDRQLVDFAKTSEQGAGLYCNREDEMSSSFANS